MKKFLKIMLCIMGSLLAVIVAFWFSISYTVNYKKTRKDMLCQRKTLSLLASLLSR